MAFFTQEIILQQSEN